DCAGELLELRSVEKVKRLSGASPEKRLPRLAPLWASNPLPVLIARSSRCASSVDVTTRPSALSYHRYAGRLWLFPCRIPAWLAPVCDDRSHSHGTSR